MAATGAMSISGDPAPPALLGCSARSMTNSTAQVRSEREAQLPTDSVWCYHECVSESTRDNTKRRRAKQAGTLVGVRLQPEGLTALDAFIAQSPDPGSSRPEAIRALMDEALKAKSPRRSKT
jgi:hypothetical protein